MRPDYLMLFNRFFSRGVRMSSTYKPILLRALLDVGDLYDPKKADKIVGRDWLEIRDGRLLVNLNFVAVRFAKYYWDMEYSFRLRQAQNESDANIVKLIREEHGDDGQKKPPTTSQLARDDMLSFRRSVNNTISSMPLRYLLTDMPGFYQKDRPNVISFDEGIVEFMYVHRTVLRNGINNVLTKYLERLNRGVPSIANKVDCEHARRVPLPRPQRDYLHRQQDSRCFYCNRRFEAWHVDHVIPFNYVGTTDLHNCTLACQSCNCEKSDKLPAERIFECVLERNQIIGDHLGDSKFYYDEKAYRQLFESCRVGYHGGDSFFEPRI